MLVGSAAILASLLRCAALAEPKITLHRVDLTDPLALCNDGSPGAYYYREGVAGAPWIVHLYSGHWCWDLESCYLRAQTSPRLISSRRWSQSLDIGGIYASDHEPFRGAHIVQVGYCSSDAFLGSRGASNETNETWGWHFRGQAIVEAVLRELVKRGLGAQGGSGSNSRLLFGGCSAGARGAMATLDFVRGLLRAEGVDVEVRGFLDAPLWIDSDPLNQQVVSLAEQTRRLLQLANASGRIPEDCRSAFPGEEWKCLFPEYRLPLLRTPHVVSFSQYDWFQIAWNLNLGLIAWPASWSAAEWGYVEAWRQRVLLFLNTSTVPAGSLYFGHTCFVHCVSSGQEALDSVAVPTAVSGRFKGARVSLLEVTSAWWEGWSPPNGRLVDECMGFDCGCRGPGSAEGGIAPAPLPAGEGEVPPDASGDPPDNASHDLPADAPGESSSSSKVTPVWLLLALELACKMQPATLGALLLHVALLG